MRQLYLQLLLSVTILLVGLSHATTTYYVNPTMGNDSNSGTSTSAPLLTPKGVQLKIEGLGTCSSRGPVVVHFMTGTYYLGSNSGNAITWAIPAADTCSANPILYTNYSGDAGLPVISGGVQLGGTTTGWTSSGSLYWKKLPSGVASSYSPEAIYYNNVRRFRTRFGATTGGLSNLLPASFPLPGSTTGRIPNQTTVYYDRFSYNSGDWPDTIAAATSTNSNYSGWNPTISGSLQQPMTSPCYSTQTQSTTLGGDIEVIDFEDWTMSRQRISCVDSTHHFVYLQGAITVHNTAHGYLTGHRYLIENFIKRDASGHPILLPGQFFIDRTTTPYTLYYEIQTGENPTASGTTVVIPTLTGTTSGAVLAANGIQNVTFSNLTFANDDYYPPTAGYSAVQSDTQLPMMVSCTDCSNVTWSGNTFTQTTGIALELETSSGSATPTSNFINGNYFFDLGSVGIMYGNLPRSSDTSSNILNNGEIENNLVQGYGRMYAGSSGIEHPMGNGTVITNNDVNDGYQTGIGVCIPNNGGANCDSGAAIASNLQINSNHVWNIGKGVTDDMGGIYVATYVAGGNEVYDNKVQDVNDAQVNDADGYGGNGIYLDQQTGNVDVENNLVFRISWHAAQNTNGPTSTGFANTWKNNIFSYGRVAMFYDGLPLGAPSTMPTYLVNSLMNNVFFFDGNGARSGCPGTTIEQNNAGCSFSMQAACTVTTGVTYSDPNVSQQWNHNVYYNPDASAWDTGSDAFHSINTGTVTCGSGDQNPLSAVGWRGTGQGQDPNSSVVTNTTTQMFVKPFCTLSTASACEQDSTQDNYTVASGYTFPTGTFSTSGFNALTAGRTSSTYPNCPGGSPCTVIDTYPTLTFSPTSTTINTLTSY